MRRHFALVSLFVGSCLNIFSYSSRFIAVLEVITLCWCMDPHRLDPRLFRQLQVLKRKNETSRSERTNGTGGLRLSDRDHLETHRPQRPRLGANGPLIKANLNTLKSKESEIRHDIVVPLLEKKSKPLVDRSRREIHECAELLTSGGSLINTSMEKNVVSRLKRFRWWSELN